MRVVSLGAAFTTSSVGVKACCTCWDCSYIVASMFQLLRSLNTSVAIMSDSALSSDIEQAAKAHRSKDSGCKRAKKSTRSRSVKARPSSSVPAVIDKDANKHHKALEKQFDKTQCSAQAAEHQRASTTEANSSAQSDVVSLPQVWLLGSKAGLRLRLIFILSHCWIFHMQTPFWSRVRHQ